MESDIFLIVPPTRAHTQRLPFAMLYISSYLESKGESSVILDFKGISTKKAYEKIKKSIIISKPKFVGITCTISEISIVKDICNFIKQASKDSIVVIGGPHPTICPNHIVDSGINFDYLVLGEGEDTFFELVDCLRKGRNASSISGIAYMSSGKLKTTKPREPIKDLDKLPLPDYGKIDMDYYCRPNVWGIRPLYISCFPIFTSRGCPYNCSFCVAHTIWTRNVRMMSAERVVEHIEYLLKRYKLDAIYFADECFTISKERVYKIFNFLREKKIKILFGCQTRINLLDEQLLKFMKNNGCIQIDLGIESGSNRMLGIMNKQITVEMASKVARTCHKIGLRHLANMLINAPGETLEDVWASLKFVKDMRSNVVLWNVYCPYLGVSWGRTLDMEDFDMLLKHPSRETIDLLEKKYKFGKYDMKLNDLHDYLYSNTFHPRHIKFSLKPFYLYSIFLHMSFLFDTRYWFKLVNSKRKLQYLTTPIKNIFERFSEVGN